MIASSAFVLTALTLTGIYMKEGKVESKDEGYTVDFSALEEEQNTQSTQDGRSNMPESTTEAENGSHTAKVTEDDLDYMPMEAGSGLVEIPGLTAGTVTPLEQEAVLVQEDALTSEAAQGQQKGEEETAEENEGEKPAAETSAGGKGIVAERELKFGESLTRPVSGSVLLPYSMDGSIYFATLDQYKYNPAVIFSAEEGTSVLACAEGKVVDIFENEEIGHGITLELGNGYKATYGQLKDISVTLDSYVDAGESLASVAVPTKYYSAEGANLYFQLTLDGVPVNPETMF